MPDGAIETAVAAPLAVTRWRPGRRLAIYALLAIGTLLVWQAVSALTLPIFFPPPSEVAAAFWKTLLDGTLVQHVGVSYLRILTGWSIGCAIAVPLGLLAGRSALTRTLVEPYIEFFRYIPPIAFIGLFLIWFGLGEMSKVLLIVYTALFVMFVNTLAGALAVEPEKIRAAQCLGATRRQIFTHVVVPATVPYIVTGSRLALGNAFMTVIAAELVAAQSGVGHLIWSARLFAQTDYVFVGIITLGLMGFCANWLLRQVLKRVAYRYAIQL